MVRDYVYMCDVQMVSKERSFAKHNWRVCVSVCACVCVCSSLRLDSVTKRHGVSKERSLKRQSQRVCVLCQPRSIAAQAEVHTYTQYTYTHMRTFIASLSSDSATALELAAPADCSSAATSSSIVDSGVCWLTARGEKRGQNVHGRYEVGDLWAMRGFLVLAPECSSP
jgi:hypothetical protein